ncbi:hypothetical protein [Mastadenovirus eidoli]|uniref:Uncharacterized protein n=1 Tax=Eidolon helvum adenovirus TaxID=2039267 RepID=A0A348FKI3_9ADEN|nr:hypothetical protein QKD40_gp30 [Eidolon helvum adenovirus]BBF72850.1 hypothetical protein [Eidolon helvum adenovirus]
MKFCADFFRRYGAKTAVTAVGPHKFFIIKKYSIVLQTGFFHFPHLHFSCCEYIVELRPLLYWVFGRTSRSHEFLI